MQKWQVQFQVNGFHLLVFIFMLIGEGGDAEFYYPDDTEKGYHTERVSANVRDPRPSLTFPVRMASAGIMAGLAEQLVQHGFGMTDPNKVGAAKDAHIASLEKQAERLYDLAKLRRGE